MIGRSQHDDPADARIGLLLADSGHITPNNNVAHAVGDKVDPLYAGVHILDYLRKRLGVSCNRHPRAGVPHRHDRGVAEFASQRGSQSGHRIARTPQSMEHEDNAIWQRLQARFRPKPVQRPATLSEGAPGASPVLLIKQAIVSGRHVSLDSPIAIQHFIAPELHSAERPRRHIRQPFVLFTRSDSRFRFIRRDRADQR